jgi:hypothetical protein
METSEWKRGRGGAPEPTRRTYSERGTWTTKRGTCSRRNRHNRNFQLRPPEMAELTLVSRETSEFASCQILKKKKTDWRTEGAAKSPH